jgi:predicted enzyme related to lactoylglutathione lyase
MEKYNTVGWFEIPVNDMDRAKQFYETVFDVEVKVQDFGGVLMGWLPSNGDVYGATGSLIKNDNYEPSEKGTLVYFSCENLQEELDRVIAAGGTIRQVKTLISPGHGNMAVIIDSEGNRIALHSKE